ncbi:MAG: nodulation protein NfeD [Acidobacteria bacterium]|nr:nodulation protein NfeD [Acidobacteriota bacterium]
MSRRARGLAAALALALGCGAALAATPVVRVYRHEGMIHGVSAAIFDRALKQAAANREDLLILELDTPGGLVDSTEEMVRGILNSPVPVCTFVAPRGAHAASAGFFILIASDVAAMAPVTRTGAAHPITAGGENKKEDIGLQKAAEDLSALIRTAAASRGRPGELAEKAVRESLSWTAEEALASKLIDVIASDREELLDALDGRTIRRADGSEAVLELSGATIVEHKLDWAEEFKNVVLHPVVMSILLSIAAVAIYVELTHPGLILPGVVGVACLLVFLYGSQVLPVSFLAAALVVLGMVMFILEIKVVSYGMLAIGGAVSVAVGMYLLFPASVPGLAVPLSALVPLVLFVVIALGFVTWLVSKAMRIAPTTGREGLLGQVGSATSELAPEGTVFVNGEVWRARSRVPVPRGAAVRVLDAEGLLLMVEPTDEVPGPGGEAPRG